MYFSTLETDAVEEVAFAAGGRHRGWGRRYLHAAAHVVVVARDRAVGKLVCAKRTSTAIRGQSGVGVF